MNHNITPFNWLRGIPIFEAIVSLNIPCNGEKANTTIMWNELRKSFIFSLYKWQQFVNKMLKNSCPEWKQTKQLGESPSHLIPNKLIHFSVPKIQNWIFILDENLANPSVSFNKF